MGGQMSEIKELALLKWAWVRDNWDIRKDMKTNHDNLIKDIPELGFFPAYCSYCEEYEDSDGCGDCPLSNGSKDYLCCPEFADWLRKVRVNVAAEKEALIMYNKIKEL